MKTILEKLEILADAAKYDVSCSSSGSKRKNNGGIGNASKSGICHTYTEDGRCVSLLKILLTNFCIYDCAFCVSRKSNDVRRVAFSVNEVVELTMNFYRRNYIEGLFLSSGIFKNADYTMERLLQIVKKLRIEERFNGYIHLKTIPLASEALIEEAGRYVDRMSINLEIPTEENLKMVAPEKDHSSVRKPLALIQHKITDMNENAGAAKNKPVFVPAGQSTQMVIGATPENDLQVLTIAHDFYKNYHLKRVYYSGYIPIQNNNNLLPEMGTTPPVIRENRLYQADWLMRFYNFKVDEMVGTSNKNLELDMDPKLGWALRNPHHFPVDVNTAAYEELIRVPGIGIQSANKIVAARRFGRLYEHQLRKIGIVFNRAQYFIVCADSPFMLGTPDMELIKRKILDSKTTLVKKTASPVQLSLL